jgi:hypothetical protein
VHGNEQLQAARAAALEADATARVGKAVSAVEDGVESGELFDVFLMHFDRVD